MQVRGAEEAEGHDTRELDDKYDINDGVEIYTSTAGIVPESDPFAMDFDFAKSLSGVHSDKKRSITAMAKRYEGKGGVGSKKIEDDVITGYNAFEVVLPPYNPDYLAKLYELNETHKAAVDAKTSNIVGLGYDFIPSSKMKAKMDGLEGVAAEKFQKKLTAGKEILNDLIDDLNKEDTFTEVLQKVWKDYETTGNGYLEISRSDATGAIGYIGHVPCTTIRVRRQRDGFVQIIANKAVFFRNFGADDPDPIGKDKNPSEIIHIKKYSPSSTYYGVPDIVSAKVAVAGQKFAGDFNLDYFENKAVPRHIVILKGATINPRLAKNILEFFETGLKGKNHRSLFIPLPSGTRENPVELKVEAVEAGVQDASFDKYDKSNRAKILMAHRVPINKVGLPEGVSLAVARDADKTFKEQVCGPEQRMFEKKLNKIIKEITDMFLLKLIELTLTDEDTQSKIDERRRKTGTETANEQRVRRGLPRIDGGDELVDLNAQAKKLANEARAEGNRERDSQRSASATDSAGEGRSAKGDGRTGSG